MHVVGRLGSAPFRFRCSGRLAFSLSLSLCLRRGTPVSGFQVGYTLSRASAVTFRIHGSVDPPFVPLSLSISPPLPPSPLDRSTPLRIRFPSSCYNSSSLESITRSSNFPDASHRQTSFLNFRRRCFPPSPSIFQFRASFPFFFFLLERRTKFSRRVRERIRGED